MKLIIDINEYYYKKLKTELKNSPDYPNLDYCQIIIASGTPVSNEGDLISRSELKKAINKVVDEEIGIDEKWAKGLKYSLKIIDNAPTVHHPNCDICEDKAKQYSLGFQDGYLTGKERPQGEWIKSEECMKGTITTIYKCSECGRTIATMPNRLVDYPFCHCGADMRGKEE